MLSIIKECWNESPWELMKLVGSAILSAALLGTLGAMMFVM